MRENIWPLIVCLDCQLHKVIQRDDVCFIVASYESPKRSET